MSQASISSSVFRVFFSIVFWLPNRPLAILTLLAATSVGFFRDALAQSPVREFIEQYVADVSSLDHRYPIPLDQKAHQLRVQVTKDWLSKLEALEFSGLDRVAQIDFILLRSELNYRLKKLTLDWQRDQAALVYLPYAQQMVTLCRDRENVERIVGGDIAAAYDKLAKNVALQSELLTKPAGNSQPSYSVQQRLDALRAAGLVQRLSSRLREMHNFYSGYDPQYSWWAKKPFESLSSRLSRHRELLRDKIVGVPESDEETIVGLPIGAEGLKLELQHEWIVHTPEELIELAKREMTWCEIELAKASEELGFGPDWNAAMEHTKSKHVQPGDQPEMIRNLAWEAIRFLESHDLLTIPEMAANGWRMTMMSPQRQRVSPYFLGGDTIIVSFPTDDMTHEEKLMSMRSNNEHFSRATVHHELIPGHHMQSYMLPRHLPYRKLFSTPFWIEGWALYWEMLLWDLDFAQSAEDRVGMLFWRKHRCARIIFSLSYHLGTMTPEQCINYLVERVGHERSAATAEVRRSIMGGYSPLYQAAYMLGGLQIREMHREFVQGGKMTNREFHDAILKQHSIPIEPLRLFLQGGELERNMRPSWRFADSTSEN